MKLTEYLTKFKGKLNDLEENFITNIFYKDYGEEGLDFIVPQYELEKPDGSGIWKYDFFIETSYGKYILETDGLYSHAQGAVSTDYFDNLQEKSNYPQSLGIKVLHLTNKKVREKSEEVIWELRRFFMGDKDLYEIYLHRIGKIVPHEVQYTALQKLEETRKLGNKKGLVVLATGLGKTYLSAFDVKNFNAKKSLFIVHVNEILKQSQNSFEDVLPEKIKEMGFYNGLKKESNKNILFASVQTLSRKQHLENFKPSEFDYIVIDETHHSAAPSYKKILDYFKPKFLLGLTATPDRMDNKDIMGFYNDNLVFKMEQEEAIEKGFLVPFKYYGFNDNIDYSNIYFNGFRYDVQDLNKALMIELRDTAVIDKFKELAIDKQTNKIKKTIGFCVSVEHANWCTEKFREAGFKAVAIHSKLDSPELDVNEKDRDNIISKFRGGEYDIAFVVNMFNEGIDIPDVECLLFLRPTESKSIFIQHMGRGLRISPGKSHVLILDFIGNYKTAGVIIPGLGLKGIGELKKVTRGEKTVYYYDNHGCTVEFEEEVVNIFRKLHADSLKKADTSLLSDEWKQYGKFIEENTKEGVNLYWKVGNKNNHILVHLWALDFISNKLNKIPSEKLSKMIKEESIKKFPGKTMEGIRALFFSKLIGLLKDSTPMELTDAYLELKESKVKEVIISSQLEKFYFWNDIFSLTNRHVGKEERKPVDDYFHIYPLFFIYQALVRLKEKYGYEPSLTKFEIDYLLSLSRTHEEIENAVERIVSFRENDEKYQIEKYLKEKSEMDSRFYKILNLCRYFIWQPNKITINEKLYSELLSKVNLFESLMKNKKLIMFNKNNPEKYHEMLYSKKSLLEYHKTM